LVIEPQFDGLWHFYEGVANFSLNEKYGFVNKKGKIVIEPQFDYASQFTNGLAYVELNGKAGFIDKKGKVVIPIIYEPNRGTRFE
ncbi:MAG: WG repeat-containing protein, partial [Bacteroidetes bacterium]|nr:WG repeat-containing protein [Bacteroidota bacterium]